MKKEKWPNPNNIEEIKAFLMKSHKLTDGTRAHEEKIVSLIDNVSWTHDLAQTVFLELINDNDESYSYGAFYALCTYYRRYKDFTEYRELLNNYRERFAEETSFDFLELMYQMNDTDNTPSYNRHIVKKADELCNREVLKDNYGVYHCFSATIAIVSEKSQELGSEIFPKYRDAAFERLEKAIEKSKGKYARFFVTRARLNGLDSIYGDPEKSLECSQEAEKDIAKAIDIEDNHNKKIEYQYVGTQIQLRFISHSARMLANKQIDDRMENQADQIDNSIFIVHGHDEAAKEKMARTLEKAGLKAVILHEQPDDTNGILEKIEQYTNVGFAVVLYTECDVGRAKEEAEEKEKYRARQNVVFEHGYLIAKLGRNRVHAFVKGNVELPGDIAGVVYTPMDKGDGWKLRLITNLKKAGLNIDANKIL